MYISKSNISTGLLYIEYLINGLKEKIRNNLVDQIHIKQIKLIAVV